MAQSLKRLLTRFYESIRNTTQRDKIGAGEQTTRYILSKRFSASKRTVKSSAYLPAPNGETSVRRTCCLRANPARFGLLMECKSLFSTSLVGERSLHGHGQRQQAPEAGPFVPDRRGGHRQPGEAVEQGWNGDAGFQAGHIEAGAGVNAAAKG